MPSAALPASQTDPSPVLRVGHVHLRVADLDRAIAFYRDALGLTLVLDGRERAIPAAFLAAGDYHHHVALSTFQSAGGTPPPEGHTGLHHVALVYPGREELARALRRLLDHGEQVGAGQDHGATVSLYLEDPDGNGLELYYDRPRDAWFDAEGRPVVKAEPFDPRELLAPPG